MTSKKRAFDNSRQTHILRYLFDQANGSVKGVAKLGDINPVATEFQGSDYGTKNYPPRPPIRRDGTASAPGQLSGLYFVVVSWAVQAAGRRPASGFLAARGAVGVADIVTARDHETSCIKLTRKGFPLSAIATGVSATVVTGLKKRPERRRAALGLN